MPTETYSIVDLARLTGVNVRTIRYYLAQGLLPASGESGPGAHYGEGHLDRLRLTKRLQQQHLPLSEIRRRLAELTDAQVSSVLATTQAPESAPTTSALDYVRTVLGAPPAPESAPTPAPPPAAAAPPPAARTMAALTSRRPLDAANFIKSPPRARTVEPGPLEPPWPPAMPATAAMPEAPEAPAMLAMPAMRDIAPAPAAEQGPTGSPGPERSQWDRLVLGPNVELHVRRPLSRLEQRRVERLIAIARQVLNEDQS